MKLPPPKSLSLLVLVAWAFFALLNPATANFIAIGPWPSNSSSPPMNLYNVDTATGLATLIGDTGVSRVQGLTFGPNNMLLGTTGPNLYSFELSTGVGTQIASLPFSSTEGGLAYRPGSTEVYVASTGPERLHVYDLASNTGFLIGSFGLGDQDVSGAGFDPSGNLYIIHSNRGLGADLQIATVDLATGLATTVLNTQIGNTGTAGLVFDDLGVGYFTNGNGLYRFDVTEGMTSLVGTHGVPRLAGLSFENQIPEPSAMYLAACSLISILFRRLRG
jgi:hypothetical protein